MRRLIFISGLLALAASCPMQAQSEVNSRNSLGATPLHEAVWSEDIALVRSLLDRKADPNARHAGAGSSPLHYAITRGNVEIASLLISRGADVNLATRSGASPLVLAAAQTSVAMVRLLIDHGAEVKDRSGTTDTPLREAASRGSLEIVQLLIERGELGDGRSLVLAAQNGHEGVVSYLLLKGSNSASVAVDAAVEAALASHRTRVLEMLLDHPSGARINKTPMLFTAIRKGQADIVSVLLDRGAEVNSQNSSGNTPLHDAAQKGDGEIVSLLLKQHASVAAKDRYGATPLHAAAIGGNCNVIEKLLTFGADINLSEVESGATSLYNAASGNNFDAVKLLVSKGADLNIRTKSGKTALVAAHENGFAEISEYLGRHGGT